ncbi:hypothetical protein AGDE_09234 [Angomonas deanei]|uniref:adenylate cyclase n=1 Tax=Angomonas deanei TaxID=59799 RepID=A0A7G2CRZ2_9TRYP|nr:hypothetical protein AGDE_09234 [Angomonas deanei]CAD2221771.1 Adenylate and Guanylate cyclase catalytic domain containing protein, putative [Angomonas deanei]|eukprot:EPY31078.1 hypothetical protein AGDE_09234 [Angomonas deanei]
MSVLSVTTRLPTTSTPPMTPSMVYTEPPAEKKTLTTGQIVGIAVGCAAFVLLLIAAIILIVCCCCNGSRDNKSAPKKLEEPVTLIFTDIESSTALWAAAPQLMPDAVATHHKLIRQLIQKYKCYEVKTIGDSFMIASKDAYKAVLLARDLQTKFLKHDWDPELDDAYYAIDTRKGDDAPPSYKLNADEYGAMWNGIRVRVGIHTGLSDIRCDDVTGGYDYYGETSNMAARTEAIGNGGQVVMTESTWWALSRSERDELDYKNMGPQGLRGVPYAVVMYQLNAVPGRTYADLRTEIDAILPDDGLDDDGNSQATDALLSSAGTLTGPAAAIAAVLGNCFSPYPPQERIRQIQPLLQKWSIPVPPRNRRITEDDYCQGLLNRLAIRVSLIVQKRQQVNGDENSGFNNTLTKLSVTESSRPASRSFTKDRSQSRQFNIQTVERLTTHVPDKTTRRRTSVPALDVL